MSSQNDQRKMRTLWPALFVVWAIQGTLFLWQFATLPSDTDEGILFGYSAFRLAGIFLLFSWILLTLALAIYSGRKSAWREKWLDSIFAFGAGDILLVASLLITIVSQALLAVLWGLSQHGLNSTYVAYATRLAPLLNLCTLIGVEFIGWMIFHRKQAHQFVTEAGKAMLHRVVLVWAALGALAIFIAITRLGISPDKTGEWGLPGVPLLEWQVLLACIVCVLTLILEVKAEAIRIKHLDFWISVGIWSGVLLLWLSQPVNPSFSALPPRAPNFEVYPFSDAQVYDEFAQSLLIGNGLKGNEIPPRPLYIVFLAFLHFIVGQEYSHVIVAQLLFLAFFPVAVYWIGKELYGRPLGIAIALLAGLREYTSNIAAPFTNALSYSKLYLSEVPVAILLVIFTFLAIRWARTNHPNFLAFMAGGVLGIGIMIRTQAVVAFPVLLFIALLTDRKKFYPILRGALLMMLAVILVTSPWLWRNWKNTGKLIFDSPFTQTINLAQRYSRMNGIEADAIRKPEESSIEYNDRLIGIFIEAVSANPQEAVRVVANRFFNNCVDNILLLPLRNNLTDLDELWMPSRAFWEEWKGKPTPSQSMLLFFYLFLLGLGISAAWKRLGLLGLLPLCINLVYNLWTSIALLAGQRFLVAMDWSIYMYYMIGLFVLIGGFLFFLECARPLVLKWVNSLNAASTQIQDTRAQPWAHFFFAGLFFFLIGISVPLSEKVFPKRYPPATQNQLFSEFVSSKAFEQSSLDPACLKQAIADNHLTASSGRGLSPRFYGTGEGEFTDKLGYRPSNQPRLLFYMTGNYYGLIILELTEPPDFFPNTSDVIVYHDGDDEHKAWFVLVSNEGREEIYFSGTVKLDISCYENP